jgi:sulfide dehydrogenase cytochrome subunit
MSGTEFAGSITMLHRQDSNRGTRIGRGAAKSVSSAGRSGGELFETGVRHGSKFQIVPEALTNTTKSGGVKNLSKKTLQPHRDENAMSSLLCQKGTVRARSILVGTLLGLGTVLTLMQPAGAQSPADVVVLAGPCANCHGTDGRSPGPIVSIAGRPEALLLEQLKAFKSDTPPPGTTVMSRLAKGYTDEQLAALAAHFSRISATAPAAAPAKKKGK